MKMVYSEGATTKSLSWSGVRNNFNDVKIGSNAKTFVATGLKTSRITDVGNSLKNTNYNFVTHNCGQNVVKSVLGFKLPFVSPTANYYALLMRQGYMSILGY